MNMRQENIILYGAGRLGELAIETLLDGGMKPSLIIDKYKTGELLGISIKKIEELTELEKTCSLVLICISTLPYNDIYNYLQYAGIRHVVHFYTYAYIMCPDVISNGWVLSDGEFDYDKVNKICRIIEHDEKSLAHYLTFLYWKRFNKEVIFDEYPVETGNKYFKCDVMPKLSREETLLDIGCYKGDIVEKFVVDTDGEYCKIIGIDPVEKHITVARERFKNDRRISFQCCAISNRIGVSNINDRIGMASHLSYEGTKTIETKTIDSLNEKPTIIKFHIEGAEYLALLGAKETINHMRPILMVMADHNTDGWYKIPDFIDVLEEYKLYFRLHDYCGNSAVWYFIPKERF